MSQFSPAGESDFESGGEDDLELFEPEENGSHSLILSLPATRHKKTFSIVPPAQSDCCAEVKMSATPALLINDLQTAITAGNVEAVKHLIQISGNPNLFLKSGWNLLMLAGYFTQLSIVDHLLNLGADTNISNAAGDTALHTACKSSISEANGAVCLVVKALLNAGANAFAQDLTGRTPIMYAARRNLIDVVDAFLGLDSEFECLYINDDKGWTVVDWAAVYGCTEILDLLVNAGMEIRTNIPSFKLWPKHVFEYVAERTPSNSNGSEDIITADSHQQVTSGKEPQDISVTGVEKQGEIDCQTTCADLSLHSNTHPQPNEFGATYDATDEHSVEDLCLPEVVTQEKPELDEYKTYGQLELFLLGLDLAQLIPLFKEQDVYFEQLLCLTMEELEIIGIAAFGTRKRILSAIHECHDKHTKTTTISDHTKTPLKLDNLLSMMAGASEQVNYIGSFLHYIKHHIDIYPDTLKPAADVKYDKAPVSSYIEKVEDINFSIRSLAESLKHLKIQAKELECVASEAEFTPHGLATAQRPRTDPVVVNVALGISLLLASWACYRRLRANF